MGVRFSPQLLDEIRARLPVSRVVSRKVQLKKAGRELVGLSPFKQEKTPSFYVNDHKGFYHCFASGEHGDVFKFVMLTEGRTFPEAVEQLAEAAGVTIPKQEQETKAQQDGRARLLFLMDAAARFYQEALAQSKQCRDYIEKRGISLQTVETFRLGYAPADRNALNSHLALKGYTRDEMIAAGMLITGDDIPSPFDRFRDRLMFPIQDHKGRVIAFGGRALDGNQPAKYLNSPETPLFHKGDVLFNLHRARAAGLANRTLIVVEGYMDVVALAEAGIADVVAPLGTALTEGQLQLIWRIADTPTLLFDGDSAGRKAAHRAIDTALPHVQSGTSLQFVNLPDGVDPDDMVRGQGAAALTDMLAQARPLFDMMFEREWIAGDWSTPEQRAKLQAKFRQLTSKIGDRIVREHYDSSIAQRLDSAWRLTHGRSGSRPGGRSRGTPILPLQDVPRPWPHLETTLIASALLHPWLIATHAEAIAQLPIANVALAKVRDAMLAVASIDEELPAETVRDALVREGFGATLSVVEAIQRTSDCSQPGLREAIERDWLCDLERHVKSAEIKQQLMDARTEFRDGHTPERWERVQKLWGELHEVENNQR